MIGQTFGKIIANQFEALRDGDRFWYQNQEFDGKTLSAINNSRLSDIILRNTDTVSIQADVFVAYNRHSGSLGGIASDDPDISQLIIGSGSGDTLVGGSHNDILVAGSGNQTLIGGGGADIFQFSDNHTNAQITDFKVGQDVISILFDKPAGFSDLSIHSSNGNTTIDVRSDRITLIGVDQSQISSNLFNIENCQFSDRAVRYDDVSVSNTILFSAPNTDSGVVEAKIYTGPVAFLQYELLGADAGDVVIGQATNDFMNLLGGDDAANGGAGRDVLDGGIGSSFLTGGTEADIFFVDGRNAASTWSTITDFSKAQGDTLDMWGWREGVSKLITSLNDGGAAGYTGATFHYDLDNNGAIDTSITFAGLTTSQVGNPTPQSVAGNGYLLWS